MFKNKEEGNIYITLFFLPIPLTNLPSTSLETRNIYLFKIEQTIEIIFPENSHRVQIQKEELNLILQKKKITISLYAITHYLTSLSLSLPVSEKSRIERVGARSNDVTRSMFHQVRGHEALSILSPGDLCNDEASKRTFNAFEYRCTWYSSSSMNEFHYPRERVPRGRKGMRLSITMITIRILPRIVRSEINIAGNNFKKNFL